MENNREDILAHGPIRFRAIEPDDLPRLRDWRNEAIAHHRQWRPLNMVNQREWLERVTHGTDQIMLAVEVPIVWERGKPSRRAVAGEEPMGRTLVGVGGLTYVDWVRRRSEISVFIGATNQRRGLGTAALRGLCAYGFDHLGLHRLYAEIYAYNAVSIRLFEKVGFRREGALREHMFHRGEWHDSYLYGLLAREWREAGG